MKKSEIARQFDYKATSFLLLASIALTFNSVLNFIASNSELNAVLNTIIVSLVSILSICTYVFTLKGFVTVNKSCKLSEDNQDYYMGRKLTIMTIVFILISVILSFVAVFMSYLISQYSQLDTLTNADERARMNIMIITAVINLLLQFFAISTPYIVYVWKLRATIPAKDKLLSNIALLTVIVMVVQLAIGVLNSTYIAQNSHSTFLTSFSEILLTVKYIVLTVFLFLRRNSLIASVPDEE